jgi:phytoene/squalene synthetase
VRALLSSEALEARTLLLRGFRLVHRVPRALAWRVAALVGGGLAVLRSIERAGFDVFATRHRLSRAAKARIAFLAWLAPRARVRP